MCHPGIFERIMLMIGLDSLESLDNCRQVCKAWNIMIMNILIEISWDIQNNYPSDKMIYRAKMLGKPRIKILIV